MNVLSMLSLKISFSSLENSKNIQILAKGIASIKSLTSLNLDVSYNLLSFKLNSIRFLA